MVKVGPALKKLVCILLLLLIVDYTINLVGNNYNRVNTVMGEPLTPFPAEKTAGDVFTGNMDTNETIAGFTTFSTRFNISEIAETYDPSGLGNFTINSVMSQPMGYNESGEMLRFYIHESRDSPIDPYGFDYESIRKSSAVWSSDIIFVTEGSSILQGHEDVDLVMNYTDSSQLYRGCMFVGVWIGAMSGVRPWNCSIQAADYATQAATGIVGFNEVRFVPLSAIPGVQINVSFGDDDVIIETPVPADSSDNDDDDDSSSSDVVETVLVIDPFLDYVVAIIDAFGPLAVTYWLPALSGTVASCGLVTIIIKQWKGFKARVAMKDGSGQVSWIHGHPG